MTEWKRDFKPVPRLVGRNAFAIKTAVERQIYFLQIISRLMKGQILIFRHMLRFFMKLFIM